MKKNKTLVIIPAYNEEENIAFVLDEITISAPACDYAVVDDGSRDNTRGVVLQKKAQLISHPVNLGYGAAVQTGLKYALACGYDSAVLMDGDGQHDARDVPGLLEALTTQGADVVIGSRFLKPNHYRPGFIRGLGMKFFSGLTSWIIGEPIRDTTSGFQALNKRALAFLSEHYPVDFPDAQVIILLVLSKFKVIEVAANFRPRLRGKSMYTFSKAVYYYFEVILAILIVLLKVNLREKRRE
jgi:hypothetical protein